MFALVITKKQRRILISVILGITLLVVGMKVYPKAISAMFGVNQGVTVNGEDFGGLMRDEALKKLVDMAGNVSRNPTDAFYFAETGEVINESYGMSANVEETLEMVMFAKPGQDVPFIVSTLAPAVTADMMQAVYEIDTNTKVVAFGINVAWGEEFLVGMLEALEERHLRTTFFLTGTWVKQFPDLVVRIKDGGHELANHGYSHPHVENMKEAELTELIQTNEKLIKEITGETTTLFAPPYGEMNQKLSSAVGKIGYRSIMWTIDTIDWQRPEAEVIIERVMSKLKPGAIILAHPTAPTLKAMPELLDSLIQQGYTVMTISEMLDLEQ